MAREAKNEEAALSALMEGYLAGRIEAFDGLYAVLSGRLRGYLLSQCRDAGLADDLLQDTFMQIHRSRRTYEPGRPVTPWVFAIARHVYLMNRRSAGRRLRFEETMAAHVRSSDVPIDAFARWWRVTKSAALCAACRRISVVRCSCTTSRAGASWRLRSGWASA